MPKKIEELVEKDGQHHQERIEKEDDDTDKLGLIPIPIEDDMSDKQMLIQGILLTILLMGAVMGGGRWSGISRVRGPRQM